MAFLKDRIGERVRVLFVGINPGLRSSVVGHHFAGPTNRFWRLLFESGLVPEPLTFEDDVRLPGWGYGLTNIIPRPTRGSSELAPQEFERGARTLLRKVRAVRPEILAPVGVSVWRALARAIAVPGIERERLSLGLQPQLVAGAQVYVLPNPSGRNAHFSYAEMLGAYAGLRAQLDTQSRLR